MWIPAKISLSGINSFLSKWIIVLNIGRIDKEIANINFNRKLGENNLISRKAVPTFLRLKIWNKRIEAIKNKYKEVELYRNLSLWRIKKYD